MAGKSGKNGKGGLSAEEREMSPQARDAFDTGGADGAAKQRKEASGKNIGHNSKEMTPERAQKLNEAYDTVRAEKAEIRQKQKAAKEALSKSVAKNRDKIAKVKKALGEDKFSLKVFNKLIKEAELEDEIAAIDSEFDDDEKVEHKSCREAIGENFAGLPLGKAAIDAEEAGAGAH